MQRQIVYSRLDEDTIKRIDTLINKKRFDNRSSFIRYAVNSALDKLEQKILA